MKYIEDVLGVNVHYETWDRGNHLPYFLTDKYFFRLVLIEKKKILFLYPKFQLDNISAVKKHIAYLQKEEILPVVLVLDSMSRYKRDVLIREHIPFVVDGKQIYLPFLGLALEEKYDVEIKFTEKFQPSTQLVFFYYLYQGAKSVYTGKMANELAVSAMTVSRAVKQLVSTGLFDESKDGVQKILTGKFDGEELFHKAKPFLINPIRKRLYVNKDEIVGELPLAGLSALSEKSMLNPPELVCYACERLEGICYTESLVDSTTQAEIELWKYNPTILGKNNEIDILSLVMSLDDYVDERVEGEIEILMERLWNT